MSGLPIFSTEPDELELKIASQSNILLPCPFCGKPNPILMTERNEVTGIFVARVQCIKKHCMASVFSNSGVRIEAQNKAIAQWQRRDGDKND